MSYEIHNADCYDFIKSIPDKSIDLVYIDIPYLYDNGGGGGLLKNASRKELYKEKLKDIENGIDYSIFDELCRIMKHIYIYIWCSKMQINDIMNYFIEKNCFYEILVWCKTNSTPFCNNVWLPDLEYCLFFREETCKLNAGYDLKSKWYISPTNKADKDLYDHPTIKPLELVKRHILHSTKEGDTVLDCFMGSGTTGVACIETNRNFIGVEIDPYYFKIAEDRLKGISQKDRRMEQYEKDNGIIRFDF